MNIWQPATRCLAALALCLATAAAPGAAPGGVALPAPDQQRIGALACAGTPGVASIGRAMRQGGTRTLRVEVWCEPVGQRDDLPLARHTRCDNHTGAWRCDSSEEARVLALPDGQRVAVLAHGVPPRVAVEMVREATKLTVPPFHKPAAWLLAGTCAVSPAVGLELAGATNYAIDCDRAVLQITRHCWRGGCRFFIARGTERE